MKPGKKHVWHEILRGETTRVTHFFRLFTEVHDLRLLSWEAISENLRELYLRDNGGL